MISWIAIVLALVLILTLIVFFAFLLIKEYNPSDYPPVPYSRNPVEHICIHHEDYDFRDEHP